MLTKDQYRVIKKRTVNFLKTKGIALTKEEENERIEIVDHGFGINQPVMAQILVYINTDKYCAKELVMFPFQIIPEHRHPPVNGYMGKQETFRCRFGKVYLYVPGKHTDNLKVQIPENRKRYFTVFHEMILHPGEQYTLTPNTLHWFHSGSKGAIVSEFSSKSIDEYDIFTDPEIKRITEII